MKNNIQTVFEKSDIQRFYEEDNGAEEDTEEDAAMRDQQMMVDNYDYDREVEEIEDANANQSYDVHNVEDLYAKEFDYDYDNANLDNYYREQTTDAYLRSVASAQNTPNKFQNFQTELQMIQGYSPISIDNKI